MRKSAHRMLLYQDQIRNLHSRRYSTGRMAKAIGIPRRTLQRWLKALGLESNGWKDPRARAELRKAVGKTLGKNPGEWNGLRLRIEAAKLGWPQAPSPTCVRVLEALSCPRTLDEIAATTGMHRRKVDYTIAILKEDGLVVKARAGRGNLLLYSRAPGVAKAEPVNGVGPGARGKVTTRHGLVGDDECHYEGEGEDDFYG